MRRLRLLLASALSSAACAQIAGFETLSSSKSEMPEGGRNSAGGRALSAGTSAGGNGNGNDRGGALGSDGAAAGAGPAASGSASGGALGGSSSGGNLASAGSAPAAAGSGGTVAAAGSGATLPLGTCNASLLRNGNFDAGPVNWQQQSSAPGILEVSNVIVPDTLPALVEANVQPKSTRYLAWIGAAPNPNKFTRVNLLQAVHIPQNVTKLIVSGWIQIKTEEDLTTDRDVAFDRLDLALQEQDPNSDYFRSLALWFFTTPTTGWAHFNYEHDEPNVLDEVRGRTLDFIVEGKFGTSKQTNFWVDSLDLVAQCD